MQFGSLVKSRLPGIPSGDKIVKTTLQTGGLFIVIADAASGYCASPAKTAEFAAESLLQAASKMPADITDMAIYIRSSMIELHADLVARDEQAAVTSIIFSDKMQVLSAGDCQVWAANHKGTDNWLLTPAPYSPRLGKQFGLFCATMDIPDVVIAGSDGLDCDEEAIENCLKARTVQASVDYLYEHSIRFGVLDDFSALVLKQ